MITRGTNGSDQAIEENQAKSKLNKGKAKEMAVPNHNPPQGMEGYDFGALSPEQQEKLNNFKMQTRVANEKYLRDHPEVDILLAGFLRDVLSGRPENIQDFAADWFTKPQLAETIDHQLDQRDSSLRDQRFQRKL